MQAQTLVVDAGMQAVNVVSWEDAFSDVVAGKAHVVAEYEQVVRSAYLTIKVPAVIRLTTMVYRKRKPAKFSRVNVYARDGYRCQYCNVKCSMDELTYDHVVPRAHGGKTEWTNIVSACVACNARKGGRTPEQAKMKLLKKPVQPIDVPQVAFEITRENAPEAWRDFMYWTDELDE